ncbi:unnamed protein product [Cylicocyclus nassatus]|uniref:Ground-like domain-containing protein n=1 Tax=Cylicocyclus nassatus TaxID=53992 RepID=A0AA36DLM5_CYLNA|nr:unnamed protein product [Cylicocyclus nassatus]
MSIRTIPKRLTFVGGENGKKDKRMQGTATNTCIWIAHQKSRPGITLETSCLFPKSNVRWLEGLWNLCAYRADTLVFVEFDSAHYQMLEGSYQQVQPVTQPAPLPYAAPQQTLPPPAYVVPQPSYAASIPAYNALAPVYQPAPSSYQVPVPASAITYTAPRDNNPVQKIQPIKTVPDKQYDYESSARESQYPTLNPNESPSVYQSRYNAEPPDHTSMVAFDETAPAIPPPVLDPASSEYRGTGNEVTDGIVPMDNEARLVPAASTSAPSFERNGNDASAYQQLHSGAVDDAPVKIPFHRRISTEGFAPMEMYTKRHMVLKRMRNARQLAATVPRTNTTCNSHKLANVMVRVMVDDVSVSKRTILRATEIAFDGDKFDVFCASGEFSYSIHSRKYCEVTKDDITCFAFR